MVSAAVRWDGAGFYCYLFIAALVVWGCVL